jgi:hypothetical protein
MLPDGLHGLPLLLCSQLDLVLSIDTKAKREHAIAYVRSAGIREDNNTNRPTMREKRNVGICHLGCEGHDKIVCRETLIP